MDFSVENLSKVAREGSLEVEEAFSELAGKGASINVSNIEVVSIEEALKRIMPHYEHSIVAYAQFVDGANGTSILILERESALKLIDLLNKQEVGTTRMMKEIDRSAIKETLNILSNSYLNALARNIDIKLGLDVPAMISSTRLDEIVKQMLKIDLSKNDKSIIFEMILKITEFEINAKMVMVFNRDFSRMVIEKADEDKIS